MERKLARIKVIFRELFLRELSDEEALGMYNQMISNTSEALSEMPDHTEERAKRYFAGDIEMVFSPSFLMSQIVAMADEIGIDELNNSHKYKRLYEMASAMSLALVLRKETGRQWAIMSQDSPDILLVSPNDESFNRKPFDAIPLEIMQIPEEASAKFAGELEADVANFIRAKKFNKRYHPLAHLLVHLDFDQENVSMQRISELLCAFPDNPFHQIWVRVNPDPTFRIIQVCQMTPNFAVTELDMENERHLLF